MESLMAESVQSKHWYLAVGDRSIGPLTTELVAKGIESGKVPLTAWICQVGASAWSALSSLGEFQDSVDHVLSAGVPANQQSGRRGGAVPSAADQFGAYDPRREDLHTQQVDAGSVAVGQGFDHGTTSSLSGEYQKDEPHPQYAEVAGTELPAFELPEEAPFDAARGESAVLPYEVSTPNHVDASDVVTSATAFEGQEPALRLEMPSLEEESGQREVVRPFDAMSNGQSPNFSSNDAIDSSAHDPAVVAARAAARVSHDDLGIDITFDEDHENAIDWDERFQSYFLVGTEVELPDEARLLQSLIETPRATFLHDEAVWNLSLCLAFGSDAVARASARTFFEAVGFEHGPERIEWICRTLLSKGFMPSGIPRLEGMRGIERLRAACPFELLDVLEREAVD